jgi:hypothetical protein
MVPEVHAMRNALLTAPLICFVIACSAETATTPSALPVQTNAGAAKAVSRANYVFADSVNLAAAGSAPNWTTTGIKGDHRLKSGVASTGSPSNEYEGGSCGVDATLGTTATFNTDPDHGWSSALQCGGPRLFNFYLNGLTGSPTAIGPHSVTDAFSGLAVGASTTRESRFGVQQSTCDGLRFTDAFPPSNNARVTRLPDVSRSTGFVKQWRIESQGSHLAACILVGQAGRVTFTGTTYYLPFAITVTEVP